MLCFSLLLLTLLLQHGLGTEQVWDKKTAALEGIMTPVTPGTSRSQSRSRNRIMFGEEVVEKPLDDIGEESLDGVTTPRGMGAGIIALRQR